MTNLSHLRRKASKASRALHHCTSRPKFHLGKRRRRYMYWERVIFRLIKRAGTDCLYDLLYPNNRMPTPSAPPPPVFRDNRDYLIEAVQLGKQQPRPEVGTVVAHETEPYNGTLIRYEGDDAIVDVPHQGHLRFPKAEIFDVNWVKKMALTLKASDSLG